MMTISIGVPTHNNGQYLAATLDSLLAQTVPPDEIVVSDDNSTDSTAEVLGRYEGRVRILRPPERLTMIEHFRYVAENLSGDWVALIGADDVAEPRFIDILGRAARSSREAVLVRGGWHVMSLSGRRFGSHRLWSTASLTRPPRTFIELLRGPKPLLSTTLVRRSALLKIGGVPACLRHSFDWGMYLRLSALGTFITTHRIVGRFRTGYPISKKVGRLVDKAHDERVIALEVAPAVAKSLGLSAGPAMRRAAEYRLRAMLSEADLATESELRGRVADELRPMAVALGRERWLDDFAARKPAEAADRLAMLGSGASVIGAQLRSLGDRVVRLGRS
jgi:hypothetical protein